MIKQYWAVTCVICDTETDPVEDKGLATDRAQAAGWHVNGCCDDIDCSAGDICPNCKTDKQ